MNYSANYAVHKTLTPLEIDTVELTYPSGEALTGSRHEGIRQTSANQAPITILNRHATAYIWLDYTYPDGSSPPMDLAPERDNAFVVLPNGSYIIRSDFPVWEIILCSGEAAPYSIMVSP